jgi:hypothetical protein
VTEKALHALAEGSVVDVMRDSHVANCCRQLVRRPRDLGLATQSLHDTAELFASMMDAALQRAERRPLLPAESSGGIGQVA